MKKLTPRERRFVSEYLIDFNGADAMRRIGHKGRRPDDAAWKMQCRDRVKAAIDAALTDSEDQAKERRKKIISRLELIAFGKQLGYKGSDEVKALELLGKHHAMFIDRAEHSGLSGTALVAPEVHVHFTSPEDPSEDPAGV